MVIPKIVEFATQQLREGKTVEDVSDQLYKVGWNAQDVQDSMLDALKVATRKPKKSKKWIFVLLFIFLFLGIGSTAAYFYVQYLPETILQKSAYAMAEVKSAKYSMSTEVTVSGIGEFVSLVSDNAAEGDIPETFTFHALSSGAYDITDETKPEMSFDATVGTETNLEDGGQFKLSSLLVEDRVFINVLEIPDVNFLDDISLFTNKWIELDIDEYDVGEQQLDTVTQRQYTIQEQLFIREAAFSTEFITLERSSSSDMIKDIPVHTISYTVDLSKFEDFYNQLRGKFPDEMEKLPEDFSEDMNTFTSDYLEEPISGQFYIGKNDFYLYKSTLKMSLKMPEYDIKGDFTFDIATEEHNKPQEFSIPEDFVKFEEIEEQLQEQVMNGMIETSFDLTTVEGRDQKRMYDVYNISNGIIKYMEDGKSITDWGNFPNCSTGSVEIGTATNNFNLKAILYPDYLASMPRDPQSGTEDNTGYAVCSAPDVAIVVKSLHKESDEDIAYPIPDDPQTSLEKEMGLF